MYNTLIFVRQARMGWDANVASRILFRLTTAAAAGVSKGLLKFR